MMDDQLCLTPQRRKFKQIIKQRCHMPSNTPTVSKSSEINDKYHRLSYSPTRLKQGLLSCEKENQSPKSTYSVDHRRLSSLKTPNTAHATHAGILGIRKRLEQQVSASCNTSTMSTQEISPGLARIQNTPGTLRKRKQELIIKHKDIQDRSDQLGVGGGVTLWPEMDVVRMTSNDMLKLFGGAVVLSFLTVLVFNKFHGNTFMQLQQFLQDIKLGCADHKLSVTNNSTSFKTEVLAWHKFLLTKSETIHDYFHLSVTSSHCILYLVSYFLGMSTLVYFLVDNMQAKNRLTPLRIKTWTCLLFVIGTWTILMAFGLYLVFRLEKEGINCVHRYASHLGHLVLTPLDLGTYQSVLLYWRTRLLDNSSHGLIQVFGIITVKDLLFYMHYYSIPVATVLLTPVVKLIVNCWTVYGNDIIKVT